MQSRGPRGLTTFGCRPGQFGVHRGTNDNFVLLVGVVAFEPSGSGNEYRSGTVN